MTIYSLTLLLHSYFRWLVVLAAVVSIVTALAGVLKNLPAKPYGKLAKLPFLIAVDTQLLIGLILACVSPKIRSALGDMATTMKTGSLRFFIVEHPFLMILAIALVHIGAARARKATSDRVMYQRLLCWYTAAFVLVMAGIPWQYAPLFR